MNDFIMFLLTAILALGIVLWTTRPMSSSSWWLFPSISMPKVPIPGIPKPPPSSSTGSPSPPPSDKPASSWGRQEIQCANISDKSNWMEFNDVLTDDGGFICNFKYPERCGFTSDKPTYSGCYKNTTAGKALTMDQAYCNHAAWGTTKKV